MRVLFFGSAAFGLPTLGLLHGSDRHELIGVVTAPDKPKGRGKALQPTPIKVAALGYSLPVYQPTDLSADTFQTILSKAAADMYVVVAFRLLPPAVFDFPFMGSVNLHASFLPHLRGAAPIEWAIIRGETHTGLTTFRIEKGMDTGRILLQKKIGIAPHETGGSLRARMSEEGATLVLKTLDHYAHLKAHPQAKGAQTRAPKLTRDNTRICWRKSAHELINFVRALDPTPGAWTLFQNTPCRIYALEKLNPPKAEEHLLKLSAGQVQMTPKNQLIIGTSTEPVSVKSLQMANKKRMAIQDFLNGYKGARAFDLLGN